MDGWSLDVVVSGTQQVLDGDVANPVAATVTGPCRVIPLEYPTIATRLIDLDADPGADGDRGPRCAELSAPRTDAGGRAAARPALAARLRPDAVGTGDDEAVLREGGVYLITGGLGGIALSKLEKSGLVSKSASRSDGRQSLLRLTAGGRKTFTTLDTRQSAEVAAMLRPVPPAGQSSLVRAMHTIETMLGAHPEPRTPYILRSHQPGDMGWVVHRHGVLYAQEYGYDERFEALVAEIVAKFIQRLDARRERCWIAEKDGEIVGSVFVVKKSKTVAKLRLLLVEPSARGLGIGKRLVD